MRRLRNVGGGASGLFSLLFFVVAVMAAVKLGTPYYHQQVFQSHIKDILIGDPEGNVGPMKERLRAEIGEAQSNEDLVDVTLAANIVAFRDKITAEAASLGIPLAEKGLKIRMNLTTKALTVSASWTETVDFWGYYQMSNEHAVEVEY